MREGRMHATRNGNREAVFTCFFFLPARVGKLSDNGRFHFFTYTPPLLVTTGRSRSLPLSQLQPIRNLCCF